MNYNFHQSLEDKCHRMLNVVEPGTTVSIHRHPTKDESFVVLCGKVRVTTYNDDGSVMESMEPNSVIFECKEGPFVSHEVEGILEMQA